MSDSIMANFLSVLNARAVSWWDNLPPLPASSVFLKGDHLSLEVVSPYRLRDFPINIEGSKAHLTVFSPFTSPPPCDAIKSGTQITMTSFVDLSTTLTHQEFLRRFGHIFRNHIRPGLWGSHLAQPHAYLAAARRDYKEGNFRRSASQYRIAAELFEENACPRQAIPSFLRAIGAYEKAATDLIRSPLEEEDQEDVFANLGDIIAHLEIHYGYSRQLVETLPAAAAFFHLCAGSVLLSRGNLADHGRRWMEASQILRSINREDLALTIEKALTDFYGKPLLLPKHHQFRRELNVEALLAIDRLEIPENDKWEIVLVLSGVKPAAIGVGPLSDSDLNLLHRHGLSTLREAEDDLCICYNPDSIQGVLGEYNILSEWKEKRGTSIRSVVEEAFQNTLSAPAVLFLGYDPMSIGAIDDSPFGVSVSIETNDPPSSSFACRCRSLTNANVLASLMADVLREAVQILRPEAQVKYDVSCAGQGDARIDAKWVKWGLRHRLLPWAFFKGSPLISYF